MSIRLAACAVPLMLLVSPAQAQMKELGDVLGQLLGVANDPGMARCESVGGKTQACAIQPGTRVEFVRQLSKTACIPGKTLFIGEDKVTVSGGCRAEFRVIALDAPGSGATELQQAIADALRTAVRKPQGEYGSLYEVRVTEIKPQQTSSSRERVHTGMAQAVWGGRSYPLEYTVRQDTASGRFLNVDYRYSGEQPGQSAAGSWVAGTALDTEARAALAQAIEAEYRRRGSVRNVQVIINTAYREQQVTRSDYRFSGRYGVSIDDGDWKTDGYEGRVFLPRNTVSELKLGVRSD